MQWWFWSSLASVVESSACRGGASDCAASEGFPTLWWSSWRLTTDVIAISGEELQAMFAVVGLAGAQRNWWWCSAESEDWFVRLQSNESVAGGFPVVWEVTGQ